MDKKRVPPTDSQIEARLESVVPLIAGLLITRGLGLQGWKAIATYLLATGVTQEILKHLPQFLADFCQSQGSAGSSAQSPPNPSDRESCRVVHHIPGRIRLSIPRLRRDREYGKAIQRLLEQERDLTGIRLNPSGGTAVITYLAHAFAGGKSRSKTEQLALEAAYFLDRLRSLDKQEDSGAIGGHSRLGSSLNSQPLVVGSRESGIGSRK